jgi:peptide/nickel transport system substrate-binding protein
MLSMGEGASYVKGRFALLPAALLVLTLSGCGGSEHPATQTATQNGATPIGGGTLIRRLTAFPATLNPILEETGDERDVMLYLHDGLIEFDKDLQIIPSLATKWEIAPDARSFVFHLDPKATFSDGTPLKASDVVFTLKKIVDPKSESSQLAGLFEGLDVTATRAIDDATVQVVFSQPRPGQLFSFSIPILPEHVYGKGDFRTAFNRSSVGTGPYVVKEFKQGSRIRLVRRDNYWRELPPIREILFKVIPDDNVAWNALLAGELDESKITSDRWRIAKDSSALKDRVTFKRFYLLGYNFAPWNTRDPILADKRVRRAMAMCLDRRSLIQNVFYGTARMISGPFTPDQWAYNPDVKPIEFDPKAAAALLAEAGWRDTNGDGLLDRNGAPLRIEMLLPAGSKTSETQGQFYQQALKKIGVTLDLNVLDVAVMFDRVLTGKYQTALLQWNTDLDPDVHSLFHSSQMPPAGQNFVYYSNPQLDQLIDQGRIETDQAKRVAIYQQIHALLAEDQPYMWMVQVSDKWALSPRIHNVEESKGLGLSAWYPGARAWWLDPKPPKR